MVPKTHLPNLFVSDDYNKIIRKNKETLQNNMEDDIEALSVREENLKCKQKVHIPNQDMHPFHFMLK